MNLVERRDHILQLAHVQRQLQVPLLARRFGVTGATIRTDLRVMAEGGLLVREPGGARLKDTPPEASPQADTASLLHDPRYGIAAQAARLVAPGDKLILQAGFTTLLMARQLANRSALTIFTNSLPIASELGQAPDIHLIVAGGTVCQASQSIQGAQAETSLDAYTFDKVFVSAAAFDVDFGLSASDASGARLCARMIARARQVIVLADSATFGQLELHHICVPERIHTVISDASIAPGAIAALAARGINVLIEEKI